MSEFSSRFDDLASAYLDGTLDAGHEREWLALLERPEHAEEFVQLAQMDRELAGVFAGPVADEVMIAQIERDLPAARKDDASKTSRIMEHVRAAPRTAPRRTAARKSWALPLAAAAIAVVAYLAWSAATAQPFAELSAATGTTVLRDGKAIQIKGGGQLLSGDLIQTTAWGAARIRLTDATQLDLHGDSRLTIWNRRNGAGKRILLTNGTLDAAVAKQQGDSMIFDTPVAAAEVLGTRLTLQTDAVQSRLDVLEGSVRFTRNSDKAVVNVDGGHFAIATPGAKLAAASIADEDADKALETLGLPHGAQVLYQQLFSARPDGDWTGDWEIPPSKGLHDRAMRAAPNRERFEELYFFSQVRSPLHGKTWTVGAHTYLRFRYLAENFTASQHIKLMFKRDADEMNYGGYIEVVTPNAWQSVTVRVDDKVYFVNAPETKLKPGEIMGQLAWIAVSDGRPPREARLWIEDPVVFESTQDVQAISLKEH